RASSRVFLSGAGPRLARNNGTSPGTRANPRAFPTAESAPLRKLARRAFARGGSCREHWRKTLPELSNLGGRLLQKLVSRLSRNGNNTSQRKRAPASGLS